MTPPKTIYIPQWYEDASILNRVVAYTVENRKLTEFAQITELIQHPEKFDFLYRDFQEYLLNRISPRNPVTNEFFDSRFYKIGTQWLPSITTILWAYPAPGLVNFIGSVGTEQAEIRKQIGGERGSRIHDALQFNRTVFRRDFDDEEWLALMHAQEFFEQYHPEIMANEEAVWDEEVGYACRFDRVVEIDGKVVLIDWKSGHVGREAWLQLAGNKNAIQKRKKLHIDTYGIVSLKANVKAGWKFYTLDERSDVVDRFGKNPSPEELETVYREDFEVLKHVKFVWHDAFRSLKPRSFGTVPPDKLSLSIPVKLMPEELHLDDVADALQLVTVEVGGESEHQSTAAHAPAADQPPVKQEKKARKLRAKSAIAEEKA
jgi:hypothetical protein